MQGTVDRSSYQTPSVRRVDPGRPFYWLSRGWTDIARAPRASLGYGLIFAIAGAAILSIGWGAAHLVPALACGFLLVAPFFATVLYAISQQIERGEEVSMVEAFFAWRGNTGPIALFALLLVLSLILWERLAAMVFALTYGRAVPDLRNLMIDVLFSGQYNELLLAYFGVGGVVALIVYACGIVSVPLMLDRDVGVVTAIMTSIRCCLRNPAAALLWAVIIAALSAIGFATFMLGMFLIFSLLGHASWHAYRDLVE